MRIEIENRWGRVVFMVGVAALTVLVSYFAFSTLAHFVLDDPHSRISFMNTVLTLLFEYLLLILAGAIMIACWRKLRESPRRVLYVFLLMAALPWLGLGLIPFPLGLANDQVSTELAFRRLAFATTELTVVLGSAALAINWAWKVTEEHPLLAK